MPTGAGAGKAGQDLGGLVAACAFRAGADERSRPAQAVNVHNGATFAEAMCTNAGLVPSIAARRWREGSRGGATGELECVRTCGHSRIGRFHQRRVSERETGPAEQQRSLLVHRCMSWSRRANSIRKNFWRTGWVCPAKCGKVRQWSTSDARGFSGHPKATGPTATI